MKAFFSSFIALMSLVILSSLAIADMQVNSDKRIYNLDEQIRINVSISQNKTINGFLKMQLKCPSLSFQFYLLPVSIEQNKAKQLSTELPASEQMQGNCNIDASLSDFSNNVIDSKSSDNFNITDKLFGYFRLDKEMYKPGEVIIIGGYIKKASGESFKGKLDIYFDGNIVKTIDFDNNFEYDLKIDDNVKGGKHFVRVITNDKNKVENEFPIFVESEARKLSLDVKEKSYLPQETVKASISLKDQAGEDIRQEVTIDIIAPDNNWLGSWKADSSNIFEYRLDKFTVPGVYTLSGTFGKLVANTYFKVDELRKLDFDIKDNIITIENSGNVIYDDIVEVYLESQKKKYLIAKKISLALGEKTTVELYKEVPDDRYNITVPLKQSNVTKMARVNETVESIQMSDINVKDERTIVKKSGDAINEITGAFLKHRTLSYLSFFITGVFLILFVALHIKRLKSKPPKSETTLKKETRKKEINTMLKDFIKK